MIESAAPPLPPAEAARRLGAGAALSWVAVAGDDDEHAVADAVASDPVVTVAGSDPDDVAEAWAAARARWAATEPQLPIAMGWFGYEAGARLQRFRDRARAPSGWPPLEWRFYDAVWLRRRGHAEARIVATTSAAAARLRSRLEAPVSATAAPVPLSAFTSAEPASAYTTAVARIIEYLRAGDAFQVNLARRLTARLARDEHPPGWSLAARLERQSPAPHAAYFVTADGAGALVGNSPERFLRVQPDGRCDTRPIKGTRARSGDPVLDERTRAGLRAAAKDAAEHAMIVDVERNDLGRVCRTGSVRVEGVARLVSFPTVHHLLTTVSGELRDDVSLRTLLAATFPGGSVTGAPKLRAMEIIAELEPAERGPYTGATGWLGAAGDFDWGLAIRTGLLRNDELTLWVGGGIVVDSDPEAELAETVVKAAAFASLSL